MEGSVVELEVGKMNLESFVVCRGVSVIVGLVDPQALRSPVLGLPGFGLELDLCRGWGPGVLVIWVVRVAYGSYLAGEECVRVAARGVCDCYS